MESIVAPMPPMTASTCGWQYVSFAAALRAGVRCTGSPIGPGTAIVESREDVFVKQLNVYRIRVANRSGVHGNGLAEQTQRSVVGIGGQRRREQTDGAVHGNARESGCGASRRQPAGALSVSTLLTVRR